MENKAARVSRLVTGCACSPPVEEGAALPVVPQNDSPRTMSSEYKYCNLTSESRITGAPSVYVAVLTTALRL